MLVALKLLDPEDELLFVSVASILAIEPDSKAPKLISLVILQGGLWYQVAGSPTEVRANIAAQLGA